MNKYLTKLSNIFQFFQHKVFEFSLIINNISDALMHLELIH